MDALLHLVEALWDWFAWFLRAVWDGAIQLFQTVWGKLLLIAAWVWTVLVWASSMLDRLFHMIGSWMLDSITSLSIPSAAFDALSFLNYVLPLKEIVVLTASYTVIALTMVVYRHVKSMIPSPLPGGGGT